MKFFLIVVIFLLSFTYASTDDLSKIRDYYKNLDLTQFMYDEQIKNSLQHMDANETVQLKEEMAKLKIEFSKDADSSITELGIILHAIHAVEERRPLTIAQIDCIKKDAQQNKKALQTEVSKVNQYLKKYKLFNIIKINKEDYKIKIDLKRKITKSEENALIRVQQELANCKHDDSYGRFGESLMEHIEGYLVQYAIKNKDESLMKSILFKDVLHGNGCNASYTEYITQNQYIPFYLHYPNIDKYLSQKEIDKATNRILDVMELYNETTGDQGLWAKYNSTFIFPDEGEEKKFKFKDFIEIVDKQSPRLANDVKLSHQFSVLSINGLMDEDDTNTTVEK